LSLIPQLFSGNFTKQLLYSPDNLLIIGKHYHWDNLPSPVNGMRVKRILEKILVTNIVCNVTK